MISSISIWQIEFERNAIIAISSIYGVDILQDNAIECRERLFEIFDERTINKIQAFV